jgi:hypothetical protein
MTSQVTGVLHVQQFGGGKGWADVWLKDKFGWEYKGQARR